MNRNTKLYYASIYGACIGLPIALSQILRYFSGFFIDSSIWGSLEQLAVIAGLVLALRYYRDKVNGGFLTTSEGLKLGTLTSLFVGFLVGFSVFIIMSFDKSIGDQLVDLALDTYVKSGMDSATIEKMEPIIRVTFTPIMFFVSSLFTYGMIGVLTSLIASLFLKRNSGNGFDDAMKEVTK